MTTSRIPQEEPHLAVNAADDNAAARCKALMLQVEKSAMIDQGRPVRSAGGGQKPKERTCDSGRVFRHPRPVRWSKNEHRPSLCSQCYPPLPPSQARGGDTWRVAVACYALFFPCEKMLSNAGG